MPLEDADVNKIVEKVKNSRYNERWNDPKKARVFAENISLVAIFSLLANVFLAMILLGPGGVAISDNDSKTILSDLNCFELKTILTNSLESSDGLSYTTTSLVQKFINAKC